MILPIILPVLAATVITGDTTASTRVKTSVSDADASVKTQITTTVNGETITVTSDQPGTIEVRNTNGSITVSKDTRPLSLPATVVASPSTLVGPLIMASPAADQIRDDLPSTPKRWFRLWSDARERIFALLINLLDKFR